MKVHGKEGINFEYDGLQELLNHYKYNSGYCDVKAVRIHIESDCVSIEVEFNDDTSSFQKFSTLVDAEQYMQRTIVDYMDYKRDLAESDRAWEQSLQERGIFV